MAFSIHNRVTGVSAVAGMIREISAPSPQTVGSSVFTFKSWSDGGAATHEITVPVVSTTYTARFQRKLRSQLVPFAIADRWTP